jgi:hypothetical protein
MHDDLSPRDPYGLVGGFLTITRAGLLIEVRVYCELDAARPSTGLNLWTRRPQSVSAT